MKKTHKIGWQKYEDVIESQISSPLIEKIYQQMSRMVQEAEEDEEIDFKSEEEENLEFGPLMLNLDENISGEIAIANNFDCWVAHTNFNLTEQIKNELDSVDGIEMLKVFSRYRFLVGVGRMFNFADVRKNIETKLKSKE